MRKIVVSIGNGLLAEAITKMLTESGEFEPYRIGVGSKKNNICEKCEMYSANMLLSEVGYSIGTGFETRLNEARAVREKMPDCQIVFLCDENSSPEIARKVMLAKKDGAIDAFFYASVTTRYLQAALEAL